MLSEEVIIKNWDTLRNKINELFPTRKDSLNKMYDEFEDRMSTMPASSVEYYHSAFPGGYVHHILNVLVCAESQYNMWNANGADTTDFTLEELLFCALHHDLGKVGFPGEGNEVYIINQSEWHVKNQGKIYTHNPKNPFSLVPDLSLYLLQYYNIPVSWNEYLGIRIHDGLYDDANKSYYISRTEDSKLRSAMQLILHHADHMAATIEYQQWKNSTMSKKTEGKISSNHNKKLTQTDQATVESLKNIFG